MNLHPYRNLAVPLSLILLAAAPASGAQTQNPSSQKESIVVRPNKGALGKIADATRAIRVTFSTPMVDLDRVQRDGQPSPVLFDPIVELRWTWVSPTEGKITFPDGVLRKVLHRARLRTGLKDLEGKLVDPQNWGLQYGDEEFAVSGIEFLNVFDEDTDVDTKNKPNPEEESGEEEGAAKSDDESPVKGRDKSDALVGRPRVRLEFSRDVRPQDVVERVRFEDSKTHERFAVEVSLEERQTAALQGWVLIEPRASLPPGRTILLVVDPLKAPGTQEAMPHLVVVPAGRTFPMKIRRIAGLNQPVKGAFVRVTVNHTVDPDPENLKLIQVQPNIPNLRIIPNEYTLDLEGSFDPRAEYRVTLKAGLKSTSHDLAKDSVWKVRFRSKRPAIILAQAESAQRASAPSGHCSFTQVNTGPLEWKVGKIPRARFLEVRARVREFGEPLEKNGARQRNPTTGEYLHPKTELLISKLGLPVIDSGRVEGSAEDKETTREFDWKAGTTDPGLYLVEISGKDLRDRAIGNRMIISRTDWVISEITSPKGTAIRVKSAADGSPVPKTQVQLIRQGKFFSTPALTDANGEAFFEAKLFKGGEGQDALLVGPPGQECLQLAKLPKFAEEAHGYVSDEPETRCVIVTDRNVYKAGETVKFKGYIRTAQANRLAITPNEEIEWKIKDSIDNEDERPVLHTASTPVTPRGSWEGEWEIPKTANGNYFIHAPGVIGRIIVGEFRPPPFSVAAEVEKETSDTVKIRVSSVHFHGAPNAGATVKWKTEWLVDNWRSSDAEETNLAEVFILDDKESPESPERGVSEEFLRNLAKSGWDVSRQDREVTPSAVVQGTTKLDANGTATFECKSPFPPEANYGRAEVSCFIDVTSVGAQTVRGGTEARVQFVPKVLGVRLDQVADGEVALNVASFDAEDELSPGLSAKAELFRVDTKSVKEIISPHLSRYRNFSAFEKVWEGDVVTPARQLIKVSAPGIYVARIRAPQQKGTPQVSDSEVVTGEGEGELPVDNDITLRVTPDRARYNVGDTAAITVEAPFPGIATLEVQTDQVLFRQVTRLTGNAQRISLPVQASFAPNAFVAVHLLKTAAGAELPAERYGWCEIKVAPADQRLQVATVLKADRIEPGSDASGSVKVSAGGRPVIGADILLFAVDEAVLALGRWQLPDFFEEFFPARRWQVVTHSGLGSLWNTEKLRDVSHSQKGFILGDAGPIVNSAVFRKDFKPLAFWNGSLMTDANGEAPFAFKAPDALTSYRVVAVVQNGAEQFGHHETQLQLAKKLQVEPALPEFLRRGDEVVLRALVRQDYADSDQIDVALASDPAFQVSGPPRQRITAKRRVPVPVVFRAKVVENAASAKIGFAAQSASRAEIKDAEQNTLDVYPATIERRTAVSGPLAPSTPLSLAKVVPADWPKAKGRCDVYLSGSSFLSKIAGLPALLEAEGSVDKIATRILAGTLLAETLEYLPRDGAADEQLRKKIEDGLKRLAQSILSEGGLPAWQGGAKLDEFATVQAAWAIRKAYQLDYLETDQLKKKAGDWLSKIIRQQEDFDGATPDIRSFALMVAGSTRDAEDKKEETFEEEAKALFEHRQHLTDEGRAWLALATQDFDILAQERKILLREVGQPAKAIDFDPVTFSSQARGEAIRLLALSEIESTNWPRATRERAWQSFEAIAKSSVVLSTQENLWLALAFNSLAKGEIPAAMAKRPFSPKPGATSKNGISVGWLGIPLEKMSDTFSSPLNPGVTGSYLVRASYEVPPSENPPTDPSLSLKRTLRNMTSVSRTGSPEAPFELGDELLITYQLDADKPHSYVEVEDQLPACFETVNPNLPMIARYFQLPIEAGVNTLPLSHVELRFARTLLYFEKTKPGSNLYSVLARVTTAGTFQWPATQVRPMYDSRFSGLSASMVVHAK